MKKIYISGPITGYIDGNKPAFDDMHAKIIESGHTPINPHVICAHLPTDSHHDEYMRVCIRHLVDADHIVLLDKWQYSAGARAELTVANAIGIKLIEDIELIKK